MNKVVLVGRITKDPELKQTSNQTAFCNFAVAVERKFKDQNGERQVDFINCVAWKQTADFIKKYFTKGSRIGLIGSIQVRSFENRDGQKVTVTEVVVDEVEFVGTNNSKKEAEQTQRETPAESAVTDQDLTGPLPFEL